MTNTQPTSGAAAWEEAKLVGGEGYFWGRAWLSRPSPGDCDGYFLLFRR